MHCPDGFRYTDKELFCNVSKNYPSLKLLGVGLTDYNLMRLQVNAFKNDADTAISESDSAFQARVNRAPRPSGS